MPRPSTYAASLFALDNARNLSLGDRSVEIGGQLACQVTFPWEEQLIDYDIVSVDLKLGKLLDQAFCLVERQKFGDADTDKSRLFLFLVSM